MTKEEYKESKKKLQAFRELPVTGISKDMAEEYAEWVEMMYYRIDDFDNYQFQISVYLPSPEEWTMIAQSNLIKVDPASDQSFSDSINPKGCDLFNFKSSSLCEGSKKREESLGYKNGPLPGYYYYPSVMGYYNLFGNVAELTSEEGIAKGGSYLHPAKMCRPETEFNYVEPAEWIGFRYIVKIKIN